ncbi:ATP-binding protein [Pseudoalteromonas sp. Ps84H-4]|uniref:ATP-binding protein n=1 Tax=Pseudoalteromonas sp. Ps84H-4 TaxID=2954502 RepID=UPI0020977D94|nr:ATP-binding protein [Pseudoalteromonas sp. Ps84H-4]MCO7249132.1 ATP-binding protein [Pseudoalteromonas sp. Ps84H-4]
MKQQFFKLYLIITVSLIALVLAFGQLYNEFFSEHEPSIQLSVHELTQIAEHKDSRISTLNQNELVLPDSLQTTFENNGIISVVENNQQFVYLKGSNGTIQKVGPITLISQTKTDWFAFFAFYLLLGAMILVFIRPVFRDLSSLQRAAYQFSKKPQRIELDIKPNSSIAPLASTFTHMSERINKFVQLHNDLSRIISHEIRTPLTRMRFALSIADVEPEQSSQIERDIDEIELRLEQYLSFARLEHQQSVFNQDKVDLTKLINCEIAKFDLYKELQFIAKLKIDTAYCEASFMAIAVQNLLINATKYAKHTIQISSEEQAAHYSISITDDGPGLPINADALIEPFKQGEGDKLASGYGLGLYIVHRIASWHGGKISLANSSETGGARITIRWPKSGK